MTADQRLLLVHAHPDDESIGQGATMAKYAAEGRGVTLVTCTGGEMGEILVPELEHLAADREDRLGEHRRGELAAAMEALGVTDHRYLGGFGTYRDSGMKWHEDGHAVPADDIHENAFWHADLTEAADHLVEVIREVRPQVMVTYDQFGGYGHPDHIQAHRVAMYGAALAGARSFRPELGEPWEIAKIYWGAMSESRMREGLRRLRESGDDHVRGHGPRRPAAAVHHRRREPRRGRRRPGLRRAQDERDARARHPDHHRRPVLRAVQQRRVGRVGAGVLPDRQGRARRAQRGRSRDRPVRRALSRPRVRVLAAVGLLLAGAVTGVATVALHDLGWGLALALAATAAAVVALPAGWWARLAFVAGWDLMIGWLAFPRPEGDYVISQDAQGYAVLGAGLVLIVVGIATLPRPASRAS